MAHLNEIVCVLWTDALFTFDYDGAPLEANEVRTYGIRVHDGPDFLTVAGERMFDGTLRGVTHVPRRVVESVTPLQELAEELRNGLESGTPTDPPAIGKATF